MRNRLKPLGVLLLAGLGLAAPAAAESNAQMIGRCLANATTGKDRIDLARWVFASMAAHPDVANISAVSPPMQEDINRTAGAVFDRLLTDACRVEVKTAIKSGDQGAVKIAFESLGKLAMQELMSNPAVAANLAGLPKYIDIKKLRELGE